MADITQVEQNVAQQDTPVEVTVYQPNGEPYLAPGSTPEAPKHCTITVVGSESKRYRQAEHAIQRRNLRSRKPTIDPADLRRNRIDQAAAAVTAWFGWEKNGAEWPCEFENVQELLKHDHILRQVEAAIAGHADFFKSNSAN